MLLRPFSYSLFCFRFVSFLVSFFFSFVVFAACCRNSHLELMQAQAYARSHVCSCLFCLAKCDLINVFILVFFFLLLLFVCTFSFRSSLSSCWLVSFLLLSNPRIKCDSIVISMRTRFTRLSLSKTKKWMKTTTKKTFKWHTLHMLNAARDAALTMYACRQAQNCGRQKRQQMNELK